MGWSAGWAGFWHAELHGCRPVGELLELGEFVACSGEADFQAFNFSEPALAAGFGDASEEVVADLGEPVALCRVGSEQGTTDAGLERPAIDVTGGADVAGVLLRVGARTPA